MNNWTSFWKSENIAPESLIELNLDIFIRSTTSMLDFNSHDVVMDIGSGDCQLAAKLADKVKEMHCLDISDQNLSVAKRKLVGFKNIQYHLLDDTNYTDLSMIKGDIKFSKIICLSVIQYYETKDDLEKLLVNVKKLAAPGARLLIADIPTRELSFLDILYFLKIASKNRLFFDALTMILKARLSSYYKINKDLGLQYYSIDFIKDLIAKHNLKANILTDLITINKRRIHLLIDL